MAGHSKPLRDEWPLLAVSLIDGPAQLDFQLAPGVPPDGRDMPDVDLDRLAAAILRSLSGSIAAGDTRSSPGKESR